MRFLRGVLTAALLAVVVSGCAAGGGSPPPAALSKANAVPPGLEDVPAEQVLLAIEHMGKEHGKISACLVPAVQETLGALGGMAEFVGPNLSPDRRTRSVDVVLRQFTTADSLLTSCGASIRETPLPPVRDAGLRALIAESRTAAEDGVGQIATLIRQGRSQALQVAQGNSLDTQAVLAMLRDAGVALVESDVRYRERRRAFLPAGLGRSGNEARLTMARSVSLSMQRSMSLEDSTDLQRRGLEEVANFRRAIAQERIDVLTLTRQVDTLPVDLRTPTRAMLQRFENTFRLEDELATALEEYFRGPTRKAPETIRRLAVEIEEADTRIFLDTPELMRRLMGTPSARV